MTEGGKRKTKRRKEECQGSGRKNDRAEGQGFRGKRYKDSHGGTKIHT